MKQPSRSGCAGVKFRQLETLCRVWQREGRGARKLPDAFTTLRRLLEARIGKKGKREFVQVLRLMEAFRIEDVTAAVGDAIARGAIGFDAIRASGVVPDRAPTATPRHDRLSLSAEGHGRGHVGARLHGPAGGSGAMNDTPQVLLAHHLKALKLPTFLREYDKVARQCAAEGVDHVRFLLRLVELEVIERERRMVDRRIKAAKFPTVKSLDSFDFAAFPDLNKALVMELARSEYVERRENIIAVGNSGTGKSHIGLGLDNAERQFYRATFNGEVIVAKSSDPAFAACRALKAKGLTGRVEFYRPGVPYPGLIVHDLDKAAGLRVVETEHEGPILKKWRPFEDGSSATP